ncbi:hypothetical protein VR46_40635 [Streptomyces sp. NRRL S-444]|nr:hypothetical protein VR46_40635 [Streptomyces sp. NRRL S-444]
MARPRRLGVDGTLGGLPPERQRAWPAAGAATDMEIYTHAVADGLHSAPVRDVVTRPEPVAGTADGHEPHDGKTSAPGRG